MTFITTTPAIAVTNVTFGYPPIKVLNGLSLQVPQGVALGLLGPNGAGKTTLLRLLVGLLKPHAGQIDILGQPISRHLAPWFGYMPQLHSLYNELSVYQNIEFFARIYRLRNRGERADRIEQVLKLVDLWPRRNDAVYNLSSGMKQRTSLACAIVHQPPLLFLDEPTVGLDPELRVNFWEFFGNLTRQGNTLIISSHTMDDAAHCDLLAFLRGGKVIAHGSPAELKQATDQPGATLEDAFLSFSKRQAEPPHV